MKSQKSFGEFLKSARLEAGYEKASYLARACDIPQSTVSRLEAGLQTPSIDTLKKLYLCLKNIPYSHWLAAAGYLEYNSFGEYLNKLRLDAGYRDIAEFAKTTGLNEDDLLLFESNKKDPNKKELVALATGLKINVKNLIIEQGNFASVFLYGTPFNYRTDGHNFNESNVTPAILPKKKHGIPVLGSIPAGIALEAVEDIIEWIDIPESWLSGDRQYFGLQVHGDSMYPEYLDGDTVIIRKQPSCDSGDDCAVMVNATDATLKRVHVYPDHLELEAINKMYGKRSFTNDEVQSLPISVIGVVVELRRKKK